MTFLVDVESEIYTIISSALKSEFPKIFTSGEYIDTPAKFPAAILYQSDSSVYQKMSTTNIDNADTVTFDAYVYSNKDGYKKSEAKKIMSVIDQEMNRLKFTRIFCTPMANIADSTIYQLSARYQAVVDQDLWIYSS